MKKLFLVMCAALLWVGCSRVSSGPGRLDLKASGKDLVLNLKSGVMHTTEARLTNPDSTAARYEFILANYDSSTAAELMKPLSNSEQIRVSFQIVGDQGTTKDTPLKAGTYSAAAHAPPLFDNISLRISTFANGKQNVLGWQEYGSALSEKTHIQGEVTITSVEGDNVKGKINITIGTMVAAKGNFTAKTKPASFFER